MEVIIILSSLKKSLEALKQIFVTKKNARTLFTLKISRKEQRTVNEGSQGTFYGNTEKYNRTIQVEHIERTF